MADHEIQLSLNSSKKLDFLFDSAAPSKITKISQQSQLKFELHLKLDLITEDRERLKSSQCILAKQKTSLINDMLNRQKLHEDILNYFCLKNAKNQKELEIEAKVLNELCLKKKLLINKMRNLLKTPDKKTQTKRLRNSFDAPLKKAYF